VEDQLRLPLDGDDPTPAPVARTGQRRWLRDLAALMDALVATDALREAARGAITDASDPAFSDRGSWNDRVETRLLECLARPVTAALISQQATAAAAALELGDLPAVTGVRLERVKGAKAPCDLVACFDHAHGATSTVPVNVKCSGKRSGKPLACALGPLVQHLTDPGYDIRRGTRGLNPDAVLLDLLRGTTKLAPARDYYILELEHRSGRLTGLDARGLVSRTNPSGTALAISRHASRENVLYHAAYGGLLPDGFDVARALAIALLPSTREGRLLAYLVAVSAPEDRTSVAAALAQLTDAQILARLLGA
jgi:hypothetical protein